MNTHEVLGRGPSLPVHDCDASSQALQHRISTLRPQSIKFTVQSEIDDVVIGGAGPVGLTAACMLRQRRESVTVVERRSWKQLGEDSADQHSFNVTLVHRSMALLASIGAPVDDLAIALDARQFWRGNRVSVHRYGLRDTDRLYSIPRTSLVRRLLQRAERLGVRFIDSTHIVSLDARRGSLLTQSSDSTVLQINANKVLVADGANSRLREDIARQADTSYSREPDGFCYATLRIDPAAVERAGLPLHHIHFVPGTGGMDLALPNRDGSMSLLLERPDRGDLATFDSGHDAEMFLAGCPPLLRGLVPDAVAQIRLSPVRRFKYVRCGVWSFGRAVLLGDAARCCPPYTGQGLNGGLHDAASFMAAFAATGHDWRRAAALYEVERREHCRRVQRLTEAHGRCLHSGRFGDFRWRLCDRVERFAERIIGYRSAYQRTVFDPVFADETSMHAMLDARTTVRIEGEEDG